MGVNVNQGARLRAAEANPAGVLVPCCVQRSRSFRVDMVFAERRVSQTNHETRIFKQPNPNLLPLTEGIGVIYGCLTV